MQKPTALGLATVFDLNAVYQVGINCHELRSAASRKQVNKRMLAMHVSTRCFQIGSVCLLCHLHLPLWLVQSAIDVLHGQDRVSLRLVVACDNLHGGLQVHASCCVLRQASLITPSCRWASAAAHGQAAPAVLRITGICRCLVSPCTPAAF